MFLVQQRNFLQKTLGPGLEREGIEEQNNK